MEGEHDSAGTVSCEEIMDNNFSQSEYEIRKKFFKVLGASFRIFDKDGRLCFFVKQKAFKLREDIRVYSDESMAVEILLIKARNIIDFSSAYDVIDSQTNEKIGAFKRRGFRSIIKDEWIILDQNDAEIGKIHEDSMLMALLRRFLTTLIPQSFDGLVGESKVFTFKQRFNPFILKIVMSFGEDNMNLLDRRMGIAAGVLISTVEGRQNN